MDINQVSGTIVDESFRIHRELGPGLLESVYEAVLARMLQRRGLMVERQKPVSFEYAGIRFDDALRLDLLVEGCVVVELKSVGTITRAHMKQLLTYLRLTDSQVGLLINFGAPTFKEGLKRIVNDYQQQGSHRAAEPQRSSPSPLRLRGSA